MHPATYGKGKRHGVFGYLPERGSREAELWDLNKLLSPLLRLPPEIRNKIYRILLSSRRIHVLHDPRSQSFHCVALHPPANPWRYRPRHVLSRGMTLLGPVCRQLYHETDLMAYGENTWSWQTLGVMERFLVTERRLGRVQRGAMREVCVKGIAGSLGRKVRGLLGGLEVVWFWEEGGRCERGRWVCEVVERRRGEGVGRPN
ncbi:hypothetical protein CPLU01_08362 [Colletotrichum plurivorum]|uniref:DUF7730 domain-containing protein n=1 Tax=Colletotrichum plurivorum TaxID=2175906 RepID=A0A8H6KCA7_9PEZI|nr:hypothetical protein CPLU01_08362 [Colletotrichum plurivorum]